MNDVHEMFKITGYNIEYIFRINLREIATDCDKELFDELCAIKGVVERKRFDEHHSVFRLRKQVTIYDI